MIQGVNVNQLRHYRQGRFQGGLRGAPLLKLLLVLKGAKPPNIHILALLLKLYRKCVALLCYMVREIRLIVHYNVSLSN